MKALVFHQPDGVVLWPLEEVALLREEWDGRLEATSKDGEAAWRPGPLAPHAGPPLHPVSPGVLINPRYVQREGEVLRLPGGWTLPATPLPAADPPPPRDPEEPLAMVYSRPGWTWLTRTGERPGPKTEAEGRRLYPDLVRAGRWLVRPKALRRIQRLKGGDRARLVLESGAEAEMVWNSVEEVACALGLPFPNLQEHLPVGHQRVYAMGLRDWPEELMEMTPADLNRIAAGSLARLVEMALWQVYRLRSQGHDLPYGRNPRGLYYNPMVVLANRAGLSATGLAEIQTLPPTLRALREVSLERGPEALAASDRDRLWLVLLDRLELFVGTWRLFTYGELGFVDRGEGDRRIGVARPEVLLLAEKESLLQDALQVAEAFDVSLLVLGGAPTFIAVEFLVEALGDRLEGPMTLVSLCDFDPYGWHFPQATAVMLERYGVGTRAIHRLVLPRRFTPEELEVVALPLPPGSAGRPETRRWLEESGGVGGRPLGIYADYLRPVERLVEAFRQETGLEVQP